MPGERPIPPPRRRRAPHAAAEERPTATSIDQNGAVEHLVSLFLAGAITPQTYVNGLRVLAETQLTLTPILPPRRRRAPRDVRLAEETPGEWPIPPPRRQRAPRNAQLAEETSGEWPIPPPGRRRAPCDTPPAEETLDERQLEFRRTRWTIGAYLRGWQMDVPQGHPKGADPRAFLEGVRPQIQAKLEEENEALNGVKFQLALKAQLRKDNLDGSEEYVSPVMRHKQEAALQNSEIDGALNQALPAIQEMLEKWTQRGSGWVVDQVETLWLDIARYQPLRGGSYIPLPAAVRNKKAVVNIKNKDNHCFWWNIIAAENPVDIHPERPGNYPQQAIVDFDRNGINSPVPISQIPRAEQQNNQAVNVFGWDKGAIVHHISKQPEDIPRITTPRSRTSTAYSTTVASTKSASTSVSTVFMAIEGTIS